jgi:predicted nucleic acid-binding protein
VILAWLRGYAPYVKLIPELLDRGDTLCWCPVSIAEIYAGARKSEETQIDNLFLLFESLSISPEMGKRAGKYLNLYSKSHGMELGDALIAAAASSANIPLWTLNRKHYPTKGIEFFSP